MYSLILANTASRVMWHQLHHLLYLNLIIGIIEAVILVKWFKGRSLLSYPLLIIANYVSTGVGFYLISSSSGRGVWHETWQPTIENYQSWMLASVLIAFIMTVVIELPFCYLSLKCGDNHLKRSLKACLIVQAVSYITCIGLPYFLLGNVRIERDVDVVASPDFVPNDLPFWVYYIKPAEGSIWRIRPDGTDDELYLQIDLIDENLKYSNPRLYIMHFDDDIPQAYLCPRASFTPQEVILEEFATSESVFHDRDGDQTNGFHSGQYAADLREITELTNNNKTWFGCAEYNNGVEFGMKTRDAKGDLTYDDPDIRITFTTGVGTWRGRNITILPGDIAVFEIGGQICSLDLNNRKLALLCMGYGPVVTRD